MAILLDTNFPGGPVDPLPRAGAPFLGSSGPTFQRFTNEIGVSVANSFADIYDGSNTYGDDHWSEITIGAEGDRDCGPLVCDGGGNFYFLQNAGGGTIKLYTAFGFTLLYSVSGTWTTGQKVALATTGAPASRTLSIYIERSLVGVPQVIAGAFAGNGPGCSMYDGASRITRLRTGDGDYLASTAGGPTITAQPEGEAAAVGATAQFAVTATGGTLTYQWQQSANLGETWASVSGGSGGTTATYTTPAASSGTSGTKYRVIVTDENGSSTSESAWFFTAGLPSAGKGAHGAVSSWAVKSSAKAGVRTQRTVHALRQPMSEAPEQGAFSSAWRDWFFPAAGAPPSVSLTVADAAHGQSADNIGLTTAVALAVADATHGHVADPQVLQVTSVLSLADATHSQTADAATLTTALGLVVQDATHAHTADAIVLALSSFLGVADSLHTHAADLITLSVDSATSLVLQDASHAHSPDALVLSTLSPLVVADATHGHSADLVTLTTQWLLALQDATHTHTADNIGLTTLSPLVLADATHGHAADAVTLSVASVLAPADALHGHTADQQVLTAASALTVADATHSHSAENQTLTLDGVALAAADALHAHTADALALTVESVLAVADTAHAHTADGAALTTASSLVIADASQDHSADNATLSLGGAGLVLSDALHGHAADNLGLSTVPGLVVQSATHAHRADGVVLDGEFPSSALLIGGLRRKNKNVTFKKPKKRLVDDEGEPSGGLPDPVEVLAVAPLGTGLQLPPAKGSPVSTVIQAPSLSISAVIDAMVRSATAPGFETEPAAQPEPLAPAFASPAPAPAAAAAIDLGQVAVLESALRSRLSELEAKIRSVSDLSRQLQFDHDIRVAAMTNATADMRREQKRLQIAVENQRRATLLMQELSDPI